MEVPVRTVSSLTSTAMLGAGALALALIAWLAAEGSVALWGIGVLTALGLGVAALRPQPLTRLAVVLLLLLFQLRGEQGTTVLEALSGLVLVAYLAHWYADAWLRQRRVVTSLFDVAALTWGVGGLAVGAVLGKLFGANAYDFRADVIAAIPFLLYLPVKDAYIRHSRAPLVLVGVLVTYGLVASIQAAVLFRSVITGATELWEIADARFASGEMSIMIGLLICFAGAAVARDVRWRGLLLFLAGALLGGLILTKSRAYWVAAVVGIVVVGVAGGREARRRLAAAVGLGTLALVAVALLFFADEAVLLASGSLNRLLTLATAGDDISLLNRFVENAGVWERIRVNPILGYGWGVQATHYSLISKGTVHWAFFHNGYLALWMKTGLWGLALMAVLWAGAIVRGLLTVRSLWAHSVDRVAALGVTAALTGFALTAFTSNPFSIFDQMLIVALALGLAHGAADRVAFRRRAAERRLASTGPHPC